MIARCLHPWPGDPAAMTLVIATALDLSQRYGRDVLRGIEQASRPLAWRLRNLGGRWHGHRLPDGAAGLIGYLPDGVAGRIATQELPCVDLTPQATELMIDELAVGAAAAVHLHQRGLPRLVGTAAWYMDAAGRMRLDGFRTEAARRGLPCRLLVHPRGSADEVARVLARQLARQPRPFGLFSADDRFATVAFQALALAGLRVPEEVAMIGADDDEVYCALAPVPLTSIPLPHQALGMAAVARMQRLLAGEEPGPAQSFAPGAVVARASSDHLGAGDQALAAARLAITANLGRRLSADEIATAAGLGRRTLERRFHAAYGHGLHAELRHLRLLRAQELLRTDPAATVSAVARAVGMGPASFAEAFASTFGTTPGAWRDRQRQQGHQR